MRRVISVCVLALLFASCGGVSSDASLESNFKSHQKELEKLLQMSNEDNKVIRIAFDFTRLENNWGWPRPQSQLGFSQERWDAYKALFRTAGVQDGIDRSGDKVFFTTWSMGLGNGHGASGGYAYLPKLDGNLVEMKMLDDPEAADLYEEKMKTEGKTLVHKISGHWYIFRSR